MNAIFTGHCRQHDSLELKGRRFISYARPWNSEEKIPRVVSSIVGAPSHRGRSYTKYFVFSALRAGELSFSLHLRMQVLLYNALATSD